MDAQQIKEALTVSKVASLFNIPITPGQGNQPCPFCQSSKAFKVYYEKAYKCFRCGVKGDVFTLLEDAKLATSFREARQLLLQHVDSTIETRQYRTRLRGMNRVFSFYHQEVFKSKDRVAEYCLSRGWRHTLRETDFGFSNSSTLLQEKGLDKVQLEELGLMWSETKEIYDEHLIFPIRNSRGSLVHLQGRNLGVDPQRRWLADKGTPSITNYLYNLHGIKSHDYAVIVEGISDCRSLLEMGEPAIATFGVNIPLIPHAKDLKHCTHLLAIFDRDKYPLGTAEAGQYKSWSQITPYLCELAIELRIPIFTWKVPDLPGIKDLNELFVAIEYDVDTYKDLLNKTVMPLHRMALEVFGKSEVKQHHSLLWALHEAVEEPVEIERLESYIMKRHENWRSYLKWMNS